MSRPSFTRLGTLLLPLALAAALVACDSGDEQAQEDPRSALQDAVDEMEGYEGIAVTMGMELDEDARASAMEDGELSEAELSLLTDSSLTVRAAEGEGDAVGESEFELVVGDETVLEMRALGEYELYALIDLPAIESVAESMDAGPGFQEGVNQFESMAGMIGLGEVASAARDGEWIQVQGLQQMMEMAEQQAPEGQEQPDQEELEAVAGEMAERMRAFVENEEVGVEHIGDDDAGQRIRVTAQGEQLRSLAVDFLDALEQMGEVSDPTGMGMGPDELRSELEASIPDDAEFSLDLWVDGGQLSQVGVDVFTLARNAGEEDVPDGELLISMGLEEFSGPVEAPETDVSFDVFEVFGQMMGGMGDLGGGAGGGLGGEAGGDTELPDDTTGDAGEEACMPEAQADQMREQLPEEQSDISDEELESMLGMPIC